MAHYTEDEVKLASIYSELKRVGEACNDLWSVTDMSDAMTFDKEDGTASSGLVFNYGMAYSQALQRPSATACAYITEMQLRMLRARSRAFCMINPYWKAVRENRISYTIGTGHVYSIVPKHKSKELSDEVKWKVQDELDKFAKINKYRRRQGEKLTRLDRDGEYFLRYHESKPDGILRVRFVEPLLIQDPPDRTQRDHCWFGVQFEDGDYEEPIGYYIRPATYDGGMTQDMQELWSRMVPASEIQHRTVNVDIGSPRGLPSTYDLQDQCVQALSTLKSMGKLVDIRARIAVIRKQVNATLGQIQPLLLRTRAGQATGAGGLTRNVFQYPYGTILDTNDQRTHEFPSQNIETDKIVHSLKSDLQAVAAAMGLADFTISGDGASKFANALVKEGPMDRAIGRVQTDLIEDDIEVYERALTLAAEKGRLPENILDTICIEIMPPGVVARDRLINTQADEILVRNGAMSPDTMAMRANLDPEGERDRIKANPPIVDMPGNGDTRSNQPGMAGKATTRGIPKSAEPGPTVNPRRAEEALQEAASPTGEDVAMAATVLSDEWRSRTKSEILSLPNTGGAPRDVGVRAEYEPGIQGVYLGLVDGQRVWAIDPLAMQVKHGTDEFIAAGNHLHWPWLSAESIVVDWGKNTADLFATLYHEVVETKLMGDGKWAYARAHRMAGHCGREWAVELRPELASLQNSP